jgi:cytochrome P450
MSSEAVAGPAGRPVHQADEVVRIPLHRILAGIGRDPLRTVNEIGRQSGGGVVRLNLGLFHPYLVISPEHVQHVLRDNAENYPREGMMWRPMRRLLGTGIAGEGANWQRQRRLVQPMFTAKSIDALVDQMADVVALAVDDLGDAGQSVDAFSAMTRIVYRVNRRIFFYDRISDADTTRIGVASMRFMDSLGARMLLPFVPESVPLPGDRRFRYASRTVDEVLYPFIRASRGRATGAVDIVSMLCNTRDETGAELDDQRVRDETIAIFTAGIESTSVALTWFWAVLNEYPDVARRLNHEVDSVVGSGPVGRAHLADLRYTRMVLQEALRLYPPGWIIPRTATGPDTVGGVSIEAGDTVMVSPYVTHRMPQWWPDPSVFTPERFAPDQAQARHRFAYLPFGGGPHMCLGSHLFTVEAQLIVAAVLVHHRPLLFGPRPVTPRLGASLRPHRPVRMLLQPTGAPSTESK